jgi:hypothetical protein
MQTFSSSEILELWERGARLHPLDRNLLALGAALPSASEDCADWPLGRRNRALFELHATCFGARLQGWSACPSCGEKVEFNLDGSLLMTASQQDSPCTSVMIRGEHFRVPTSRDLAAVLGSDRNTATIRLLKRCHLGDSSGGGWDEDAVREAGETLAAADPLAETQLALDCPSCGHQWNDVFDIGSFVWAEIEARARRLLWEVHTLASEYGWSEAETLSLSAARRARYLRMVQA